jgi:hypothetical protein
MKITKKVFWFIIYYLYSLIMSLFLFSIGLVWGKNRSFMYSIAAHFGPFDAVPGKLRAILPRQNVSSVYTPGVPITILEPAYVDGNVTLLELSLVCHLLRQSRAENIFEIGTFDGRTTLNLAANSAPSARVFTLDLPTQQVISTLMPVHTQEIVYIKKDRPGTRFLGTQYETRIVQLYGDSAAFDFAPFLGKMDFVFVDGSHAYEYVVSDTNKAFELLRNGKGTIVWHDYNAWDGVTRTLNSLHEHKMKEGILHIEGTTLAYLVVK